MERVGGREEKMEGHCSTGESPQRAVVPMEEEDHHQTIFTKLRIRWMQCKQHTTLLPKFRAG